jgi:gamma-glutamyl phosphate reductase
MILPVLKQNVIECKIYFGKRQDWLVEKALKLLVNNKIKRKRKRMCAALAS